MNYSRRDLGVVLPALALARAAAQSKTLPSKIWRFEDLPVRTNGQNRSRAVLNGETHTGFNVELHETELAAGQAPHPPHHHVHEEIILIREGTLEVTIAGRTANLGPGSVAFAASNEEHGWRNVGATPAHYFVFALGRDNS